MSTFVHDPAAVMELPYAAADGGNTATGLQGTACPSSPPRSGTAATSAAVDSAGKDSGHSESHTLAAAAPAIQEERTESARANFQRRSQTVLPEDTDAAAAAAAAASGPRWMPRRRSYVEYSAHLHDGPKGTPAAPTWTAVPTVRSARLISNSGVGSERGSMALHHPQGGHYTPGRPQHYNAMQELLSAALAVSATVHHHQGHTAHSAGTAHAGGLPTPPPNAPQASAVAHRSSHTGMAEGSSLLRMLSALAVGPMPLTRVPTREPLSGSAVPSVSTGQVQLALVPDAISLQVLPV